MVDGQRARGRLREMNLFNTAPSRQGGQRAESKRHHPPRWRGCSISFLAFLFIVIVATPPSPEYVSSSASAADEGRSSPSVPKKALATGDVLVKCDLVTPFDGGDEPSAEGTLEIAVHRGVAPLASSAFLDMVTSHHFDHNYLFRAVKGFVVQWGIESPKPGGRGKKKLSKAGIDPPPSIAGDPRRSNARGSLNFAGGNSASGQVYVNRGKNSHLDKEPGSLPFATLDERSMAIIDAVHSYKEGMGQVKAVNKGDEEVEKEFPRMSRIEKCWIDNG